jgi:hypothetical protein
VGHHMADHLASYTLADMVDRARGSAASGS